MTDDEMHAKVGREIAFHLGYRSSRATDAVMDAVFPVLREARADRDRARDAAVALEQENARLTAAVWRVGELCEDASAIGNRPTIGMIRTALNGGEAL